MWQSRSEPIGRAFHTQPLRTSVHVCPDVQEARAGTIQTRNVLSVAERVHNRHGEGVRTNRSGPATLSPRRDGTPQLTAPPSVQSCLPVIPDSSSSVPNVRIPLRAGTVSNLIVMHLGPIRPRTSKPAEL